MTLRLAQVADVRLGRQRAPQYEQGDHLVPYLRSANVTDGNLDLADVKSMNFEPAEQVIFGLANGDVLMTEGSGSADTVGTSAVWRSDLPGTVCFQNTLLRLRPRASVTDGRFLAWWARHVHASGQIAAVTTGANIQHIGADGLKGLSIHVPALQEQRRIADFLDDRVSRIDQIITARHDQIARITTQAGVAFEGALAGYGTPPATSVETGWWTLALPSGWRATTLGTVLRQLTNGYVGPTREILVDDGIRYVQSTHIKNGEIDFDRRPFFVTEGWHRERPRINLRVGDVLIVQTGAIGEAALVPAGFGEASCHALLIARVHQNLITPDYLIESLRSRFGHESMLARATGALHPHLEAGVKTTPLVLPPIKIQGSVVNLVGATRRQLLQIKGGLLDSIASLAEYKQSLIAAAVTGELDVTTAGSGIPG